MTIRHGVTARAVAGGAALSLTAMLVPVLSAAPAGAASAPEVVASGLHGPTKLTFDGDGSLYVAEAGTFEPPVDPESSCVGSGDEQTCVGDTGAVASVDLDTGDVTRVVEGLPSLAGAPTDVAVHDDGSMDVSIGCGCGPDDRGALEAFSVLGTIQHIDAEGTRTTLADIAQFEFDNNPDSGEEGSELDSNPFDLESTGEGLLVADAGGNDVLAIDGEGTVSLAATFPFRDVPAPPFLGAPPGTMIPMQPVPTTASLGDNGLLVSGLPGFPFPPGGALIYHVAEPGAEPTTFAGGLSGLTDLVQAPDGTVYALQFATDLLAAESGGASASELVQIRPDGTRKVIMREGLVTPGGVAIGPDGMIYVTNDQFNPEGGTVLRVDPDQVREPATASACDPTLVPGTPYYEEIAPSSHREAIECVSAWELLQGRGDTGFGPGMALTRGQAALVIQRLLARAGIVADGEPDAFGDDDGTIYEDAVDLAADLGIVRGLADGTYRPQATLTRGQFASMLAATWTAVTEVELSGLDAFGDDDGSVHEAAINAVADAGWMIGSSAGVFEPSSPITRGQASSALARMLSSFVDAGDLLAVPWDS